MHYCTNVCCMEFKCLCLLQYVLLTRPIAGSYQQHNWMHSILLSYSFKLFSMSFFQALIEAVRTGNYLQLQDLWDKPTTDIDMTWVRPVLHTVKPCIVTMSQFLWFPTTNFKYQQIKNRRTFSFNMNSFVSDNFKRFPRNPKFLYHFVGLIDLK